MSYRDPRPMIFWCLVIPLVTVVLVWGVSEGLDNDEKYSTPDYHFERTTTIRPSRSKSFLRLNSPDPTTTTSTTTTTIRPRRPKPPTNQAVGRAPAHGDWSALINRYSWPALVAYRVMMCESGGDANAYNPRSGATGLFQILDGPFDPEANVALAFKMWSKRGWQPWRACI